MSALVAIPCYNCTRQITRVLSVLSPVANALDLDIVIIDNGSSDGTVENAMQFKTSSDISSRLRVFQNEKNYGLGGSQKIAIKKAKQEHKDWLIVLHGDDQADPNDIPNLLGQAKGENKSVLGSRFMQGSKLVGYQKSRVFGNRILNILFTLVTGRKTKDLGSGLNIFKVSELAKIDLTKISDEFNFNVDILLQLYRLKSPLIFCPIVWRELDQISNARNFQVAWSMFKSLMKWRVGISSTNMSEHDFRTHLME